MEPKSEHSLTIPLMHDVGDQHFIGVSIVACTHKIVRLGASFGSPVHAPWVTETGS